MLPQTQQIRFCTSRDGTRIAYGICGSGPPLVWVAHFVHDLDFDWDSPVWRPWITALAKRHTLIRFDFRGTGLSDRTDVEFTFDKLVEDFEAVFSASGVTSFSLLAMSGGARVVLPFVVQNPDRVDQLVLYGTSAAGPLTAKAPLEQVENMQVQLKAFEMGWPQDIPGFGTFLTSLHIPDATAEQARSFNDLLRLTTSAENGVALLRTLVESDMQDLLQHVRCPTLVFHSRRSAVLPFDEGRKVAALIPGARFVPLESRNHILLGSEPAWKQFVRELDDFFARTPHDGKIESFEELTARERDVVELLAHGMTNADISARLKISAKTVRNHVSTVLGKLGAKNRARAVAVARDAGFGRRVTPQAGSSLRSE
ncbi:alpha/beta fold hydrolase [Bradyrhizobium japonicum]|uniref:alpha/beta fold hydrolase n=1 Tax=Bradyrhizobium japonicum TaxID=375 RepID=UPI0027148859|nr:alpha/beta fold hydrolase [Bradyrhizobium japonicum]WLB24311.1 alpha/beta fold hydrolase [Bradyrhizobium japonicum]